MLKILTSSHKVLSPLAVTNIMQYTLKFLLKGNLSFAKFYMKVIDYFGSYNMYTLIYKMYNLYGNFEKQMNIVM